MYTWTKEQHNGFQHYAARDNYLPELYIVDYDCQCFIHCIKGGIGFINRCYLGIRRCQNLTSLNSTWINSEISSITRY